MESRLYEEGYDESLLRAVAALNETPASTEAILGLLQKHWDCLEEKRSSCCRRNATKDSSSVISQDT